MKALKVIGVVCVVMVINNHVHFQWWEGGLLSFGIMLALG